MTLGGPLRVMAFGGITLLLGRSAWPQTSPTLSVVKVAFASGAQVEFSASDAEDAALPRSVQMDKTDEGHFLVGIDTSDIEWDLGCRCFRYYYFYLQAMGSKHVMRFKVQARPSGTFSDQWEEVRFQIDAAGITDRGHRNLPLADAAPVLGLEIQDPDKIQEVYLSGESPARVTLKNVLSTGEIYVDVPVVVPSTDRVWAKPIHRAQETERVMLGPGATETIEFQFTPRSIEAATRSFSHLKADEAHMLVPLSLIFANPEFKDRRNRLDMSMRLRFKPALLLLALSLVCGVLIGSLPRLATVASLAAFKTWLQGSLAGLTAACCLWVIGLFLVGLGSQLVLFTFNFDPWQTLPTAMIGLTCGVLGQESLNSVKRALKLG